MGHPRDEMSLQISETVSALNGTPIDELPPLSTAIDVDALDAIVPSDGEESPTEVAVTFDYAGARVFVHSGNTIFARPIDSVRDDPSIQEPADD